MLGSSVLSDVPLSSHERVARGVGTAVGSLDIPAPHLEFLMDPLSILVFTVEFHPGTLPDRLEA
jgi:hypothetical protein